MNLVKASQSRETQKLQLEAVKALQADVSAQMRCLVSQKGYSYARNIARDLAKEFECKPTDPNWQVYTTIKWSLDKLFSRIEEVAKAEEPKEIRQPNARNGRNRTR